MPTAETEVTHAESTRGRVIGEHSWIVNGIDGETGDPLLPPMTAHQLAAFARGQRRDAGQARELGWWARRFLRAGPRRGLLDERDPRRLREAGWGVVFARDADPALREALTPLLDHRRSRACRKDERLYRELSGDHGYRPGESKIQFLQRLGVAPGPVDPRRMPYYLMLVGDPSAVPFNLQYQLDVQHAVGRVDFETVDDYAAYAQAVVTAETRAERGPAVDVTLFGVENPDDRATRLSSQGLVQPLAERLADVPETSVRQLVGERASKAALVRLLAHPPDLLFSAGHGLGFPAESPRQRRDQGALLCSDWPGTVAGLESIPRDHYLAAGDVPETANLDGLIVFLFACFGGGTPEHDDFAFDSGQRPRRLAATPCVSRLPQRLLARGAAAAVAHVDRAWGWSFTWPGAGRQLTVFETALRRLLAGHRLGYAMEPFDQRYAELASDLSDRLNAVRFGRQLDDLELASLWTAQQDARNYLVLGDPAVRLRSR